MRVRRSGWWGSRGRGSPLLRWRCLRLLPESARVGGGDSVCWEELLALPGEMMRRRRGREIAMIFQEPMTALNPVMSGGGADR